MSTKKTWAKTNKEKLTWRSWDTPSQTFPQRCCLRGQTGAQNDWKHVLHVSLHMLQNFVLTKARTTKNDTEKHYKNRGFRRPLATMSSHIIVFDMKIIFQMFRLHCELSLNVFEATTTKPLLNHKQPQKCKDCVQIGTKHCAKQPSITFLQSHVLWEGDRFEPMNLQKWDRNPTLQHMPIYICICIYICARVCVCACALSALCVSVCTCACVCVSPWFPALLCGCEHIAQIARTEITSISCTLAIVFLASTSFMCGPSLPHSRSSDTDSAHLWALSRRGSQSVKSPLSTAKAIHLLQFCLPSWDRCKTIASVLLLAPQKLHCPILSPNSWYAPKPPLREWAVKKKLVKIGAVVFIAFEKSLSLPSGSQSLLYKS